MITLPVPEAPLQDRILEPGPIKRIFLDRDAAAKGAPAWLVYVEADKLVYRAEQLGATEAEWYHWSTGWDRHFSARGHKDTPLFPEGPAYWIETAATVFIFV